MILKRLSRRLAALYAVLFGAGLFLAAAARIGVDIASAFVVGDSIWDMIAAKRARALGIGLLSGGYGREELERSGALRVYEDPADMLTHLDEVGGRRGLAQ